MTPPSPPPQPDTSRPRRGGRPTLEQAAQLDRSVREKALELFLEHGSPGKEAVFRSVLAWAMGRTDWPVPEPAEPEPAEPEPAEPEPAEPEPAEPEPDDLEAALTAIADAAPRRALDPSMVRLGQIAIAHASRFPEIAHLVPHLSARGIFVYAQ